MKLNSNDTKTGIFIYDNQTQNVYHKRRWFEFIRVIVILLTLTLLPDRKLMAQDKKLVRLAKIKVDPLKLEKYNAALKEQITTAIRVEPGVLSYYAVADKSIPSNITIFEIYADTAAYNLHIATPHFKKYKDIVKNMVKSLELVDVILIESAKKPGM